MKDDLCTSQSSQPFEFKESDLLHAMKTIRQTDISAIPHKIKMHSDYWRAIRNHVDIVYDLKPINLTSFSGIPFVVDETLPPDILLRVLDGDDNIIHEERAP